MFASVVFTFIVAKVLRLNIILSCFVYNMRKIRITIIMYANFNSPVAPCLGQLTSPIALNRLSVSSQFDHFAIFSLCLDGQPVLSFGESPADNFLMKEELHTFLQRQSFQSIFILDSKRVLNAHELDPPSSPQTLPELYELYGVKVFSEFNGVPFHLGDMFELKKAKCIPENFIEHFRGLLKQQHTLLETAKHCAPSLYLDNMLRHLKQVHIADESRTSQITDLTFMPTSEALAAFIDAITSVWSHEKIYIHCASGSGRTGFHVLLIVMLLTHCNFAAAFDFMKKNYKYCIREVERSYLPKNQQVYLRDLLS